MPNTKSVASAEGVAPHPVDDSYLLPHARSLEEGWTFVQYAAPLTNSAGKIEFSGHLVEMNRKEQARFFNPGSDKVDRKKCPTGGALGRWPFVTLNYSVSAALIADYRDGLSKQRLRKVIDYIHSNLQHSLHVTEIARIAFISPYYFGKLFKRSTGQTVHQFVLEQRVRRAQSLLSTTDIGLSEIASSVGLANQSHFTTVFKTKLGVTPGCFRHRTRSRH